MLVNKYLQRYIEFIKLTIMVRFHVVLILYYAFEKYFSRTRARYTVTVITYTYTYTYGGWGGWGTPREAGGHPGRLGDSQGPI